MDFDLDDELLRSALELDEPERRSKRRANRKKRPNVAASAAAEASGRSSSRRAERPQSPPSASHTDATGEPAASSLAIVSARPEGASEHASTSTSTPPAAEISHEGHIPCCLCGLLIKPNAAALCARCLAQQVDITSTLDVTALSLTTCKDCERWRNRAGVWMRADLESRELLQICLKSIAGLDKLKLINARFEWTEPHSRRVRVALLVQAEALRGVTVRQELKAEFVVSTQQCRECARAHTDHTWLAVLQLRQRSAPQDRRTLLFVEQAILKNHAAKAVTGMKQHPNGLDFYFQQRAEAQRLLDFLQGLVPLRSKFSQRLISHDPKSNTAMMKHTISCDVVPISRGDLVVVPDALVRKLGGLGRGRTRLALCTRVGQSLTLMEPTSLVEHTVSARLYFHPKHEFTAFLSRPALVEFFVLDVAFARPSGPGASAARSSDSQQREEEAPPSSDKPTDENQTQQQQQQQQPKRVAASDAGNSLVAEVQCVRAEEIGGDVSQVVDVLCHFGARLRAGDTVLGFDLRTLNDDELEALRRESIVPQVVLVKKKNEKGRKRRWKVKRLVAEDNDVLGSASVGDVPADDDGEPVDDTPGEFMATADEAEGPGRFKRGDQQRAKRAGDAASGMGGDDRARKRVLEDTEALLDDLEEDEEMQRHVLGHDDDQHSDHDERRPSAGS